MSIETSLKVLLNTDPGENLGYGARKGEEEQFLESLNRSLEYCKALGAKRLHIMAGKKIKGVTEDEAMGIFEKNLRKAIPLLEENGVIGLIEPINPYSVPDYNMDSFQSGLQLVKYVILYKSYKLFL